MMEQWTVLSHNDLFQLFLYDPSFRFLQLPLSSPPAKYKKSLWTEFIFQHYNAIVHNLVNGLPNSMVRMATISLYN